MAYSSGIPIVRGSTMNEIFSYATELVKCFIKSGKVMYD